MGASPVRDAAPPLLDEHGTRVAAPVDDVWEALLEGVDASFSGRRSSRYARLVGCEPSRTAGPRPLDAGSTLPGFRVAAATPGTELRLEGRHRFATYVLAFHLEPDGPSATLLRARSSATFPGVTGRLYRLLVIDTRFHVIAVRRLLAGIRHRAEGTP